MSIVFTCHCGQPIKAPDNAAGLKARCRYCGEQLRVPATSEPRPSPTSSGSWIMLVSRAKADRPAGS
jgi:hypothetical protein